MSKHLSENLEEWPLNPFDILGVPHTAEKSEVRRAYSALIRTFRPETHPTQFQRIRESFEAAVIIVESRSATAGLQSPDLRIDLSQLNLDTSERSSDSSRAPDKPSTEGQQQTQKNQVEAAERLWNEFSIRPETTQLEEIRTICASNPAATTLLIGYWMLRMRPEFSATERSATWLIRGINDCPLDSRFVELLIYEFRRQPDLTSPEFSGKVAGFIRNSELLCFYLHARWSILGERQLWSQLSSEIADSRKQLAFDYPGAWFYLMMLCFRLVIFSKNASGRNLLKTIQAEIDSMNSLHLTHAEDLDYNDLLLRVRDNRQFTVSSKGLDELLKDCASLNRRELRRRLYAFVAEWIDSPVICLDMLEHLAADCPEAVTMLLKQMANLRLIEACPHNVDEELSIAVCDLLHQCIGNGYSPSRHTIAEFCHARCLTGLDLVSQLDGITDREPLAEILSDTLRRDAILMLSCQLMGSFLKDCTTQDVESIASQVSA